MPSGMFGKPDVTSLKASGDVAGLIKALRYRKDEPVQAAAARALGETGGQRALGPLEAWIRESMPLPPGTAIGSIGKIGGQAAAGFLLQLFSDCLGDARTAGTRTRASVARALADAGDPRAIDPLKAWLFQSDESGDHEAALDSIAKIGGAQVTGFLLELLPDPRFRDSAVMALGYTGDPRAVTRLLPLLTDTSVSLSRVATALGRLGDAQAVAPLCALLPGNLQAEDKRYIAHLPGVADALGMLGDPRAVPVLCDMLRSAAAGGIGWDTPAQRNFISAVRALERIGDPGALPALRRVRSDPPSEEDKRRASRSDFDAGHDALQFAEARSKAVSQAIATLEGR